MYTTLARRAANSAGIRQTRMTQTQQIADFYRAVTIKAAWYQPSQAARTQRTPQRVENHMPNRIPNSFAVYLLAAAVVFAGLTACNQPAKSREVAPTSTAPPAAPVEAPPPPEPASALGSASGTLQMADFANEADFWAFDKDPSEANRAKAQGQVKEEFRCALAQWKPRSHSLVIYLFTGSVSTEEANQLKSDIVTGGEALRKRSSAPQQLAALTVTFQSYPPPAGPQTASVIIDSRGSNKRSYSATGSADVQVSILPLEASWARPGRILPEIALRTSGKSHYGGSSFGSREWQIETRVPVVITSGY
jgi:hypothetical protein